MQVRTIESPDEFLTMAQLHLFNPEHSYVFKMNKRVLERNIEQYDKVAVGLSSGYCPPHLTLDFSFQSNNALSPRGPEPLAALDRIIKHLVEALQRQQGPERLKINFSGIRMDLAAVEALAEVLKSAKCPQKLSLDLTRTLLDSQNAAPLIAALSHLHCPPELEILLDDNPLSKVIALAISELRKRNTVKHAARSALTLQLAWRHRERDTGISKLPVQVLSQIYSYSYAELKEEAKEEKLEDDQEPDFLAPLLPILENKAALENKEHFFAKKILRFFDNHPAHPTRSNVEALFNSAIDAALRAAETRSNYQHLNNEAHLQTMQDWALIEKLFAAAKPSLAAEDLNPLRLENLKANFQVARGLHQAIKNKNFQHLPAADNQRALQGEQDLAIALRSLRLKTLEDFNSLKLSLQDAVNVAAQAEKLALKVENQTLTFQDVEIFRKETEAYTRSPVWPAVLGAIIGIVLGIILGTMLFTLSMPAAALGALANGTTTAQLGAWYGGMIGFFMGGVAGIFATPKHSISSPELEEVAHCGDEVAAAQPLRI